MSATKSVSPLRYPGGKSSFYDTLRQIRRLNGLGNMPIVEPFAGGAGASLTLLSLEETPSIQINDRDRAVFSFWWTILNRLEAFEMRLRATKITIAEWKQQRDVYRSTRPSRFDLGFATFFLNRCNRSGIIVNGGPIGGIAQDGKWRLDVRFNKEELLKRCRRISEFACRIAVTQLDAMELISRIGDVGIMLFLDPPYFQKGGLLYLNSLDEAYHLALSKKLAALKQTPWVLTYDDCKEVRTLYEGWASVRPFSLKYAASTTRAGREVLITPKGLKLPSAQVSTSIVW